MDESRELPLPSEAYARDVPALPPEVQEALLALARDPRRVGVSFRPWDAWVTVAVIQFAARNPQLSEEQRAQATRVGRALQRALAELAPAAESLLELGWNPAYGVRKDGR